MSKYFNITGSCIPEQHYMVNIHERLEKIRDMIDRGDYFVINRGRQYGKTTTLNALETFLIPKYLVINLDFQLISNTDFSALENLKGKDATQLINTSNSTSFTSSLENLF